MKYCLVYLIILILGFNSIAQEESNVTNAPKQLKIINDGFGLRLSQLFLTMQSDSLNVSQNDLKFDPSFGLAIAYSHLVAGEYGWSSNLILMKLKNSNFEFNISRLDANLTFGLPDIVFLKLGVNLSHILKDDSESHFQPGLGFQVGYSFQFLKKFSIDLGYVEMHQSAKLNEEIQNYSESGLEISATQNF